MKAAGAIRHQLKQIRFRHLKRRLEEALAPRPENCVHNQVFPHPMLMADNHGPARICVCPQQKGDRLCDPAWHGIEKARTCPLFEAEATKESIKEEFREWLSTAKLYEIAAEYPDIAALMWVLQDEAPNREVEIPDGEDWEPEPEPTPEPEPEPTPEPEPVDPLAGFGSVVIAGVHFYLPPGHDEALWQQAIKIDAQLTAAEERARIAERVLETVRTSNTSREAELEAKVAQLEGKVTALEFDLAAKTRDHAHAGQQVVDLERQIEAMSQLPAPAPTPWWKRLFGGAR